VEASEYKYWAFISYSHADEAWAAWLHKALERYRVPARLVGRQTPVGEVPRKLFPVFRDRDELAGSAELGPELQKALKQSHSQIVICSPRAAQSRWVNEEIKYFKSLGRADRVFALIVDGEPHALEKGEPELECFPEALRFHVSSDGRIIGDSVAEPIAADARRHADGKSSARLKLIAGILGLGYDDLRQRELQARTRRLGFITALASGVAAVTIVLAVQAWQARNDAQRRQQQAEGLIEFMLGDLREKLEPIGKLDILDAVGNQAMEYFATLDKSDRTDAALASRGKAMRQIGHVRLKQGDFPGASAAFQEALKLHAELVDRHPADAQLIYNMGESEFSVASAHYLKGEIEQALPWLERYLATAQRLVALDPASPEWHQEVVSANTNLGAAAFRQRQLDEAQSYFESARASQQALVARHPENQDFIATLWSIHGWLSAVGREKAQWGEARDQALVQVGLMQRLLELAPDDARYRYRLADAMHKVIHSEARLGRLTPDAPLLQEVLQLAAALVELDPENIDYARTHEVSLAFLSEAHLSAGRIRDAAVANAQALEHSRRLYGRAPEKLVVVDDLLAMLTAGAKLAWLEREPARALALLQEAIELPLQERQLKESSPHRWLDIHLLGWWIAPDIETRETHAARVADWMERIGQAGASLRPELALRYEALKGNTASARKAFDELGPRDRADPFIREVCRAFGVCEG
jgi:eukaryotic-like serine/threonine-protein kinase